LAIFSAFFSFLDFSGFFLVSFTAFFPFAMVVTFYNAIIINFNSFDYHVWKMLST
jgi:hypothetical protein